MGLHKEFIRPTDYEVGAEYNRLKEERYFVDRDTTGLVRVEAIDAWVGRSRYLPSIASSIFLTGRYFRARHGRRPEVTPTHNPLFHDTDDLLVGLGLYREKFYSANLVHGFGIREYLAAGYRAELTGGYSWGEFDDRIYVGARIMGGGFTRPGYLSGSASVGSYIDRSLEPQRRGHRPAVVLEPLHLPPQPHPSVPGAQLHPGLEPRHGQ